MKIHLPNNLQYLREEKLKKTQKTTCEDLSKMMGVELKIKTYSSWERGVNEPSIGVLWYLAKYFDTPLTDILYKNLER